MSMLNWQVNSFSNFASFFIVVTQMSRGSFKLINFLLCMKGPKESPNFETLVCSGENLPNFLCYFPILRSAFLQILLHTPVSWNIAPLYFFSSNIKYFGQKQPIKVWIFGTFEFSSQNLSNWLCQFWKGKSISLQIFHHSSVSLHIIPL